MHVSQINWQWSVSAVYSINEFEVISLVFERLFFLTSKDLFKLIHRKLIINLRPFRENWVFKFAILKKHFWMNLWQTASLYQKIPHSDSSWPPVKKTGFHKVFSKQKKKNNSVQWMRNDIKDSYFARSKNNYFRTPIISVYCLCSLLGLTISLFCWNTCSGECFYFVDSWKYCFCCK